MTRTGRPPKQGKSRDKSLNLRLTSEELSRIERCSKTLDKNRTDTIMHGISLIEGQLKQK